MAGGGMATPIAAAAPAPAHAADDGSAVEQKIEHCLQILKGKSDEHKFAGLLMVTKLDDLPWERLQQVRRQVLATVGVKFFLRLLHTKGADAGGSHSSFQLLGLNLIASFCSDVSIAEQFADEQLIRFLLEQLESLSASRQAQEECLRILDGVVDAAKGKRIFLSTSVLAQAISAVKNHTQASRPSQAINNEAQSTSSTLEALWSLVEKLASDPQLWRNLQQSDLAFICSNFAHTSGAVSITVLGILNKFMVLVDNQSEDEAEESTAVSFEPLRPHLDSLRRGILRFLRSKWPHQERDECLKLVHQLMKHAGTTWMLADAIARQQSDSTTASDAVSGGKFVLVLLKLVSIEIKLMLDDVELALIQMEETAVEQVDETERQEREVLRVLHVLPVCYDIVEMVIGALVESLGDDENEDREPMLPYELLLEMKQSFNQAFAVILEFLTLAREFMKTHRYRDLRERHTVSVFQLDAVVYASVRVVAAWIAEDSDSGMEQLVDLLPFLVLYEPLIQVADGVNAVREEGDDIEELDSDDGLDSDDEVEMEEDQLIQSADPNIDQLHFLLPGLLQLSATSDGARALSQDTAVLKRVLKFCCSLCAQIADSSGNNGRGPSLPTLTLALGMLVNLLLGKDDDEDHDERAPQKLPNVLEWQRALSFLLPLACASGSAAMHDAALATETRGEDDQYVMLLHVECVVLLIASHANSSKTNSSQSNGCKVAKLVAPFNEIVKWTLSHPPDEASESAMDLFELVRILSMRAKLTPQVLVVV